jgi:hypothetical protein
MNAPPRQVFVYYRVAAIDLDTATSAVRSLQSRLQAQHPALHTGLLRRAEERDAATGLVTLMETYAASGGVSAPLQAAIEAEARAALAPWLRGERHAEVFVACA